MYPVLSSAPVQLQPACAKYTGKVKENRGTGDIQKQLSSYLETCTVHCFLHPLDIVLYVWMAAGLHVWVLHFSFMFKINIKFAHMASLANFIIYNEVELHHSTPYVVGSSTWLASLKIFF